jgi:hypothetical protein
VLSYVLLKTIFCSSRDEERRSCNRTGENWDVHEHCQLDRKNASEMQQNRTRYEGAKQNQSMRR